MLPALLALLLAPAAIPSPDPPGELAALVEELRSRRDAADPALVRRVAGLGTPEAGEALVSLYDLFDGEAMRREVLRGLGRLDGVPGAEGTCLGKLLEVGVASPRRALREEALAVLATCAHGGHEHLARIVRSSAADDVRALALDHLAAEPGPADRALFRALWSASEPAEPAALRARAFRALSSDLGDDEVRRALRDRDPDVRARALDEALWRGLEDLEPIAEEAWERPGERVRTRLAAAGILVDLRGRRGIDELCAAALRIDAPPSLRDGVADLVARHLDGELERRLVPLLRSRRPFEVRFALRALADSPAEEVREAARALVDRRDASVASAAIDSCVRVRDRRAVPRLEALVDADRDPALVDLALRALDVLQGAAPVWRARLRDLAASGSEAARNRALRLLAAHGGEADIGLFRAALDAERWSTRLAGVEALEAARSEYGVAVLAHALGGADGRLAHEIAGALRRLTGVDHGTDARAWAAWSAREIGRFRLPSAPGLPGERPADAASEEATHSVFYGLRIVSRRVGFVLDTSGSMAEPTGGRYRTERGPSRLAVAKRELRRALGSLAPRSRFAVLAFSDGVRRLSERAQPLDAESAAGAADFVDDLRAGGGTNLSGALLAALEDPELDTLYLLTDGEPSAGEIVDPEELVRVARERNTRRVVVNCIAVGDALPWLAELAEDSGGTYVHHP